MLFLALLGSTFHIATQSAPVTHQPLVVQDSPSNPNIDFPGFVRLSDSVLSIRNARLIDQATFLAFSEAPNTIILDTRSKAAYDDIHVQGAIHLNFSDFTEGKLTDVIPSKDTRILIYCNNNFISPLQALASKRAPLALNIPTFINLYGYGYHNIFELDDYLNIAESILKFEGQAVEEVIQTQALNQGNSRQ